VDTTSELIYIALKFHANHKFLAKNFIKKTL